MIKARIRKISGEDIHSLVKYLTSSGVPFLTSSWSCASISSRRPNSAAISLKYNTKKVSKWFTQGCLTPYMNYVIKDGTFYWPTLSKMTALVAYVIYVIKDCGTYSAHDERRQKWHHFRPTSSKMAAKSMSSTTLMTKTYSGVSNFGLSSLSCFEGYSYLKKT